MKLTLEIDGFTYTREMTDELIENFKEVFGEKYLVQAFTTIFHQIIIDHETGKGNKVYSL